MENEGRWANADSTSDPGATFLGHSLPSSQVLKLVIDLGGHAQAARFHWLCQQSIQEASHTRSEIVSGSMLYV